MHRRSWAAAIHLMLLCSFWPDAARAVVLVPSVDFTARRTGSSTNGSSGGPSLEYLLDSTSPTRLDYRVAMEFPLDGLPTNQVLASATLRMMPTAKTGDSLLEAHGYSGDGSFLPPADAFGDQNLIGIMTGHTVGVEKSVDLDLNYILSLFGSATHVGIFMRELTNGAQGTFASRHTATPPELELIFLNSNGPNSNRWIASGTGNWTTSSNWLLGTPIPSDDIFIQPSAASTVLGPTTFDDVQTMTIGGGAGQATFVNTEDQQFMSRGLTTLYGNGVLDINGGTYRTGGLNILPGGTIDWGDDGTLAIESGYLSTPPGPFTVEGPQTPILAMIGGHFYKQRNIPGGGADSILIGDTQGGYLLVAGESEVLTRIVRVGNQATGNGVVQIEEGGLVRVTIMEVGPQGGGRLDVQEGGRLEGGLIVVGSTLQGVFNADTPDSATFTDPGTTAKLSSLEANGRSVVEIRNGAVVEAGGAGGSGDLADPPVLRVTGEGSRLILSDRLQTGSTFSSNGASKVFVENGGRIDTDLVVLGVASSTNGTSHAELTVTGMGSEVNTTSTVLLGGLRTTQAIVNITDGGVFRAGGQSILTATANDIADVTISGGGRWEQTGEISIGGGRDLNNELGDLGTASLTLRDNGVLEASTAVNIMDRGTLVLDGGRLTAPLVRHDRGGTFQFTAGRLSVDSFAGNLVNEGGTISPGASPGLTAVQGDFTQAGGGRLEIEIGGRAPATEFDRLTVTGAATLAGALDVSLIDDFVPVAGDSFEVLRADGGIFDAFSTTSLPTLPGGLLWDVVYSNFAVLLQVAAAGLSGDFNEDGKVDAADYVVWRKNDGMQDGYDAWRANFGRTEAGGAGGTSAVPEPSAMICVLALLVPLIAIRLSRRTLSLSAVA
jgi:hypothetical protein